MASEKAKLKGKALNGGDNQEQNRYGEQMSWYGDVTSENYDKVVERNKLFTEQRRELFFVLKDVLDRLGVPYWIDCGSLLGAYRCKGILPHDHDLDLAVFSKHEHERIREELRKLPAKFAFKDGTNYSKKYEVYNREAGLNAPVGEVVRPEEFEPEKQWYNVAGDIYMYTEAEEDDSLLFANYYGFGLENRRYKKEWVFPLSTIEFEGVQVPCPRDVENYLEEMYGYIGEDYRFDPETQKYVKKEA